MIIKGALIKASNMSLKDASICCAGYLEQEND